MYVEHSPSYYYRPLCSLQNYLVVFVLCRLSLLYYYMDTVIDLEVIPKDNLKVDQEKKQRIDVGKMQQKEQQVFQTRRYELTWFLWHKVNV